MKLTKKQEAEVLEFYNAYSNAFLTGDVRAVSSFFDDNCHVVGSSIGEVFNNKKSLFKYLRKTIGQVKGRAEYRNRDISVMAAGNNVVINELYDFYLLMDGVWIFYGHGRASIVISKKGNKWKIIHIHRSLPDAKAEKGEQLATKKIKAENIQLRDAVKRRTIELEEKNRELEIETALEKVRSVAMGMKEATDMPGICKIISEQLVILGVEQIRNVQTVVFKKPGTIYLDYEYYPIKDKSLIVEVDYQLQPDVKAFAKRMMKASDTFYTRSFKGGEVKQWNRYQKKTNQFIDPRQQKAKGLHFYFYSIGNAALGISSFIELSKEQIRIFKKFRNVFELAYKRFVDIQKAEAQAREAEIELALERIRASTMAMHTSEDLLDLIMVVAQQLEQLGIKFGNVSFGVNNADYDLKLWMAVKGYPKAYPIQWTFIDNPGITRLKEAQKNPDRVFSDVLTQAENNEWMQHIFTCNPGLDIFSKENKKRLLKTPGYARSIVVMKDIFLVVGNYVLIPYTEEENVILKRFATVFEQSYTRFLDLQKAEAQAREAQIEAALEKVRSRSLAMHKSDELNDVIKVLLNKLQEVGISMGNRSTAIFTFIPGRKDFYQWAASPELSSAYSLLTPYFNHPVQNDIWNTKESNKDFLSKSYLYKETNSYFKYLFENTELKKMPQSEKDWALCQTSWDLAIAFEKNSALAIGSHTGILLNEQEKIVLKRFARVFEQCYVRFLDLKKAEAQAREAQIEAALERVRSRAMAMQSSDELNALIGTVFTELTKLDLALTRCVIWIIDKETNAARWWMANSEDASNPAGFYLKYHEHQPYQSFLNEWRKQTVKWVYDLHGQTKKDWDDFLFSETELVNLPSFVQQGMRAPDRVLLSASFNNFGSLNVASLEPLSDEHFDTLLRFAKVFDLTYTRFNDLKQAEAQNREAKIELGLERVRARAMAMQGSNELKELIATMSSELGKLDIVLDRCFIVTYDTPTMGSTWWMSNPETPAEPIGLFVKYHEQAPYLAHIEAWQDRKVKWEYILEGDVKKTWDQFLFNETEFSLLPAPVAENMRSKEKVFLSSSFNNFGFLTLATLEPLSNEQFDIMLRFAKVFDLTYTRFNDLKQAEAQAREAQIQLALERVRARTMAMHSSDELDSVIKTVYSELKKLDVTFARCFIMIFDEHKGATWWMGSPDGDLFHEGFYVQYHTHPPHLAYLKGWEERQQKWEYSLEGQVKKDWDEFVFYKTELSKLPPIVIQTMMSFDRAHLSASFENFGCLTTGGLEGLSEESFSILSRFAKVFDLSYTRFRDLQKAEAQARESQIQLALERVRARTMAMQHSDELPQAANLLFQQVQSLGMPAWSAGYCIWDDDKNAITLWMSSEGVIQPALRMPLTEDPSLIHFREACERGESFFVEEVGGEELKKHYDYLRTLPGVKESLDEIERAGFPVPTFQIFHLAYFSRGFLLFITYEPVPQAHDIFKRFGKVFDQTYTRFLDLQKAEAQAREAKIEAALERVRSKAMAMHASNQLKDVALELRNQMGQMAQPELEVCAIHLYDESPDHFEAWAAARPPDTDGQIIRMNARFPKKGLRIVDELMEAYHSGKKDYVLVNEGEKVPEWLEQLKQQVPDGYEIVMRSLGDVRPEDTRTFWSVADFQGGALVMTTYISPNDEARSLLRRFANVFGLAYRRFVDLKQAEAQTREAQIELALERVRARTMAMHKSEELAETAQVMFQQLQELGGIPDRIAIGLVDDKAEMVNYWSTDQSGSHIDKKFHARLNERTVLAKTYQAWKENRKSLIVDLHGDDVSEWLKFAREEMGIVVKDEFIKERRVHSFAFFSHGWILVTTHEPQSAETIQILERFASVFNLTYRRFLDLQIAEAQAHEARIEISLERIRARALAMHKSDELLEVAKVLWEQMALLGQRELEAAVVHLYEKDPEFIDSWRAVSIGTEANTELRYGHMAIPKNCCELVREWLEKFYSDATEYTIELSGAKQQEWYEQLSKFAPDIVESMRQKHDIDEKRYYRFSKFSGGALLMVSKDEPAGEVTYLQKRAAVVFDLAYRRFSDLQKSEAQAREAQIEAALERVRSRTMGMRHSDELSEVVAELYHELEKLDFNIRQCVITILDKNTETVQWWSTGFEEKILPRSYVISYKDPKIYERLSVQSFIDAIDKKIPFRMTELSGENKRQFDQVLLEYTDLKNLPDAVKAGMMAVNRLFVTDAFMKYGMLEVVGTEMLADEKVKTLQRFSVVFEQTYTRFLDLQKAEAQARESRIELALERVRAKTMAMHKSEELAGAASVLFEQLTELGVHHLASGFTIIDKEKPFGQMWLSYQGDMFPKPFPIDFTASPILSRVYDSWKEGNSHYINLISGEQFVQHIQFLKRIFGERIEQFIAATNRLYEDAGKEKPDQMVMQHTFFSNGSLILNNITPIEEQGILNRFAKVFDQTYTRFLDLKKAETQAREAQIEAALEKIRASAMAMHKSDDLHGAVTIMFEEFQKLNLDVLRCGIGILNKDSKSGTVWATSVSENGLAVQISANESFDTHPLMRLIYENWQKQKDLDYMLEGQDLIDYYHAMDASEFKLPSSQISFSTDELKPQYYHGSMFKTGGLYAFSNKPFTEEDKKIMKRFASVVNLTYNRFLDLQKAEASAREAQIEAGLERVRSRTMAMHSSDDVSEATATMFAELEKLGIQNLRGGITIIKPDQTQEVWSIMNLPDGRNIRAIGVFDMRLHPLWREMFTSWENKEDFKYYWLGGQDKENYVAILNATPNYLTQPIKNIPDVHVQCYLFGEGAIWTNSLQPHSEEDKQIMKRFASVFSLTFRRYQDLKKAEAQAKEATIEAALEKVRGKAMAMHNSNDLSVTASMVITELRKLGISPIRCGVGIINKETHKAHLYTATSSPEGDGLSVVGWVLLEGHPVLELIYEKWAAGEDYFPELSGESMRSYYEQLLAGLSVPLPDFKATSKHYGHFIATSVGCLYAWSAVSYNDEEIKILKRFASIIDLTFRRYFELQKSEENAREAVKQAALDRIRADIASMRTIGDLERITPLIWNELMILGIPFIRCGVFIMDESQQLIHTFLSTPDGKAIAAFHLPYDTPGNISKVLDNWRHKKIYLDHWDKGEFSQFAEILKKQGALTSPEQYLKTIPQGGFYLHFLPFLQGMLYVGNTEQLNDEQIQLIQHVADAFSTAYARYEDFNKLEAAKAQVENTLTDLRQAQQQLVQSEKMASLGELTAGIAHEIQNPLNFVNNFSDVSNELLEEMKGELATGNTQQAIEIANDVIDNLDKILHHGKRADAIVKGMLQHSRTSSGQKEMTDINVLADEYLRLAYHGLRAKDKTFNAKFETHFDDSIGKINVIPQDIGRVILNLINNAFYTVSEKKKQAGNARPDDPVGRGYEPTVTVTTQKDNGKIEIKVKDNGNGIPQKVLDKIFQPFFTTKPTGQGTGLGLSLAYDIITKGHGGELKVETREGQGSEFIIQLPTN